MAVVNKMVTTTQLNLTCVMIVMACLTACQPTHENTIHLPSTQPSLSQAVTHLPVNYHQLMGYQWTLTSATDSNGKPILEFSNLWQDNTANVVLRFNAISPQQKSASYDGAYDIGFSVGCNGMSKNVSLNHDILNVAQGIASTTMGCEKIKADAENKLAGLLSDKITLDLEKTDNVMLTMTTQQADTLKWTGEPTARTKYGVEPTLFRLQVAPQMVSCDNNANKSCLWVRQLHYEDYTGKQIIDSAWYAIPNTLEGYQHNNTLSTILVERYRPNAQTNIHDVWIATESSDFMITKNAQVP